MGRPRPSPLAGRKGAGHIWAAGGKIIEVPTPGGGAYLARFPGEGFGARSSARGLPKSCRFLKDRIGGARPQQSDVQGGHGEPTMMMVQGFRGGGVGGWSASLPSFQGLSVDGRSLRPTSGSPGPRASERARVGGVGRTCVLRPDACRRSSKTHGLEGTLGEDDGGPKIQASRS